MSDPFTVTDEQLAQYIEGDNTELAQYIMGLCKERQEAREQGKRMKTVDLDNMLPIIAERKIGRNEQCPCGSLKKYKKCCMGKE